MSGTKKLADFLHKIENERKAFSYIDSSLFEDKFMNRYTNPHTILKLHKIITASQQGGDRDEFDKYFDEKPYVQSIERIKNENALNVSILLRKLANPLHSEEQNISKLLQMYKITHPFRMHVSNLSHFVKGKNEINSVSSESEDAMVLEIDVGYSYLRDNIDAFVETIYVVSNKVKTNGHMLIKVQLAVEIPAFCAMIEGMLKKFSRVYLHYIKEFVISATVTGYIICKGKREAPLQHVQLDYAKLADYRASIANFVVKETYIRYQMVRLYNEDPAKFDIIKQKVLSAAYNDMYMDTTSSV